ncbi:hypothetical protein D9M68_926340 [compost metagenome]
MHFIRLSEPPIWPAVPQRGVVPEVFAPVAISTIDSIMELIQRLTLASKSALMLPMLMSLCASFGMTLVRSPGPLVGAL